MTKIICVLFCLFATAAFADVVTFSAMQSVRIGSKVFQVGDTAAMVRRNRDPDKITDLINNFGVKKGEQWLYDRGNGSFSVIMVNNDGYVFAVGDFIDR